MRKPRRLVEGAWYHVTARVNRRELRLAHAELRELFQLFLQNAKKKFRFELLNFCIMHNHIHLEIRPSPNESLSTIMRWLLGGFARAYNRRCGETGHFWGDRFHSWVLEGLKQLALAFVYIDNNPVKAGLAILSGEWRHCGAWLRLQGESSLLDEPLEFPSLLEILRSP